ncbi:MAG: hypothetical protein ACW98F_20060 [Candidatus Hodarchaeales archaeon]|jgi:hypothetical protein
MSNLLIYKRWILISGDIIFSIFDVQEGPTPLFTTCKKDNNLAQRIALKSHLTMAMEVNGKFGNVDGILPLPDLGKIAYVFLFCCDQTERIASLSYIVDEFEEMGLYSKIAKLKNQALQLSQEITEKFFLQNKAIIDKELELQLCSFGSSVSGISEGSSIKIETMDRPNEQKISLSFLLEWIKKDLDEAILALLLGKPIIVVGHKINTSVIVNSLSLFTPFPINDIVEYTSIFVDPQRFGILGIPEELLGLYNSENIVIINTNKRAVLNGKKSKFLQKFVKTLRSLKNENQQRETLSETLNRFKFAMISLTHVLKQENVNSSVLSNFFQNYTSNEKELVLKITQYHHPEIYEIINRLEAPNFNDLI